MVAEGGGDLGVHVYPLNQPGEGFRNEPLYGFQGKMTQILEYKIFRWVVLMVFNYGSH